MEGIVCTHYLQELALAGEKEALQYQEAVFK